MPEELIEHPLPAAPVHSTPEHAPVPVERHAVDHPPHVTCGFCESRVTTSRGELIRLSDRARTLRDSEEECERLKKENAVLARERDEWKRKHDDATRGNEPVKKSVRDLFA